MPDVVIDSTVLVSSFLTARPGGASHELLRFAAQGAFNLHLSPAIVRETEDVLLTRKHLRDRYDYSDEDVHTFIANLQLLADVTAEITDVPAVVRDANDDMVIACAIAVGATFIVTPTCVTSNVTAISSFAPPKSFWQACAASNRSYQCRPTPCASALFQNSATRPPNS
jgi:putative PIN family toxin of toxin-antitoxin system